MNQVTAELIPNNKTLAIEKYTEIVGNNLDNLKEEEYVDPDKFTHYECEVDGLTINLAQDGLCGFKDIKKYSKNIEIDYRLIREGMFDCLVWPTYAMSINQMRYTKYKDRLDLTLIDIQKFYFFVNLDTEITPDLTAIIYKKCDLGRAYVFPHTFYWLRSFEDFNNFIKNRNLGAFVYKDENEKFIAKKWTSTENFDIEYFEELLRRVKKYKNL